MNVSMITDGMYLKSHAVFTGLKEEQLYEISGITRLHILKKKKRLIINSSHSNRIYFLINGKIKVTDSGIDNSQPVKDILYPGEMFGNVSLNGIYSEECAEALVQNTLVYCFATTDFKNLLKVHHRLALNYADAINRKLSLLKERYSIWTRYDTKIRLIYLLHKWSLNEGKENGGNIILTNYLSLTDMADILSVSRQFLYVILKEMTVAGQIKYSRRQIELQSSVIKDILSEVLN